MKKDGRSKNEFYRAFCRKVEMRQATTKAAKIKRRM